MCVRGVRAYISVVLKDYWLYFPLVSVVVETLPVPKKLVVSIRSHALWIINPHHYTVLHIHHYCYNFSQTVPSGCLQSRRY